MTKPTEQDYKWMNEWIKNTNVTDSELHQQPFCNHTFMECCYPIPLEMEAVSETIEVEPVKIRMEKVTACTKCNILEEDYNKYVKGKLEGVRL